MAQFTKVNGDFKPLINFDTPAYTNTGLNAATSGVTVQPQGPKLDFFTITANAGMTGTQLLQTFQAVEQLATVHIYEYTDSTDDTLALAIYPTGAWTTTTLDTAVTAATGLANVVVTASATFTN